MINLKKVAKRAITLSELMEGKEKIETKDIIKYHKEKITINAAERVTVPDETKEDGVSTFYVYTFKEEPKNFAFAGAILNKVFDNILAECGGDIGEFNEALAKQNLTVKLSSGKTKDNENDITLVEVI